MLGRGSRGPCHSDPLFAARASPLCLGADRFEARARTAGPGERERLAAMVPWFESQQALTGREIPIVVLEKAGR